MSAGIGPLLAGIERFGVGKQGSGRGDRVDVDQLSHPLERDPTHAFQIGLEDDVEVVGVDRETPGHRPSHIVGKVLQSGPGKLD